MAHRSDVVILPAVLSGIFHLCWVVTLVALVASTPTRAWPSWHGCDLAYPAFFAGMFVSMVCNLILDCVLAGGWFDGLDFCGFAASCSRCMVV